MIPAFLFCKALESFDDLNNPVRPRIDQHRPVIHDRVAVVANAVLGGHLVIGHAAGRQDRSDADLLLVSMGGRALLNHVLAEARALIVGQSADDCTTNTADDCSHRSAYDCTADRSGGGSCRRASGLSLCREWESEERHGGSRR
jgi:hypothetical protein